MQKLIALVTVITFVLTLAPVPFALALRPQGAEGTGAQAAGNELAAAAPAGASGASAIPSHPLSRLVTRETGAGAIGDPMTVGDAWQKLKEIAEESDSSITRFCRSNDPDADEIQLVNFQIAKASDISLDEGRFVAGKKLQQVERWLEAVAVQSPAYRVVLVVEGNRIWPVPYIPTAAVAPTARVGKSANEGGVRGIGLVPFDQLVEAVEIAVANQDPTTIICQNGARHDGATLRVVGKRLGLDEDLSAHEAAIQFVREMQGIVLEGEGIRSSLVSKSVQVIFDANLSNYSTPYFPDGYPIRFVGTESEANSYLASITAAAPATDAATGGERKTGRLYNDSIIMKADLTEIGRALEEVKGILGKIESGETSVSDVVIAAHQKRKERLESDLDALLNKYKQTNQELMRARKAEQRGFVVIAHDDAAWDNSKTRLMDAGVLEENILRADSIETALSEKVPELEARGLARELIVMIDNTGPDRTTFTVITVNDIPVLNNLGNLDEEKAKAELAVWLDSQA